MLLRLALLSVFAVFAPAQEVQPADSNPREVRLSGTVIEVTGDDLKVRVPANHVWLVHLSKKTSFGFQSRQVLAGQDVYIVGTADSSGEVQAQRVAVYNTDLPMQQDFRK
jgi:hypothetical protein